MRQRAALGNKSDESTRGSKVIVAEREAIAEMRRAENLDPLSLIISSDMADVLLIARRYDQSIQQSRKTMEMDRGFAVSHYELGAGLRAKAYVSRRELQNSKERWLCPAAVRRSNPILLMRMPFQARKTKRWRYSTM